MGGKTSYRSYSQSPKRFFTQGYPPNLSFAHFGEGFRDLNQRFFVQNCVIARCKFCPIRVSKRRRIRSDCQADFASYDFSSFLAHTMSLATQFSKLPLEMSER
jgi:hypothetical protein